MSFLNHKESSLLPTFVVGTAFVQVVLFLVVILTFGKIDKIATSKTPTLVELNDGTTARVTRQAHGERSPQIISAFVGKTMVGLLSWNSILQTLPNSDDSNSTLKPQLDEGVIAGEGKVTTATWESSFALSEDFRATFLTELAKLTPSQVFTGNTQSLLLLRHISEPQKIDKGKWKQDMVANLVVFENGKQIGQALPFNKTIFVRSIDTPLPPKNASEIQISAYKARKDGLEIYRIQELAEK